MGVGGAFNVRGPASLMLGNGGLGATMAGTTRSRNTARLSFRSCDPAIASLRNR